MCTGPKPGATDDAFPNASHILPAGHGPGPCVLVSVAMQMVATERAMREDARTEDEAAAGNDALPVAREVWRHPTTAELERRRVYSDERCRAKCSRCAQCVRGEQVARNVARFGHVDWPGGNVRGVAA